MPYPLSSTRTHGTITGGVAPEPFSPDDITGLKLWLDASEIVASDGDPLLVWNNQVGADATDVVAAAPTYELDGLVPSVHFNGTQLLEITSGLGAFTHVAIYMVVKMTAAGAVYWLSMGSGDANAILANFVADKFEYFSSPRTVIADRSGAIQIVVANVGSSVAGLWAIGSASSYVSKATGDLYEILAYETASDAGLSAEDNTSVMDYLTNKWL